MLKKMTTAQLKDQVLFTLMRVYTQRMKANMLISKKCIKHDTRH